MSSHHRLYPEAGPHWLIFRTMPSEIHHPQELKPEKLCWSGNHETPLISNLLEEPDPDQYDWWLVTTIEVCSSGMLVLERVFGQAECWIDGQPAGCLTNAFRRWRLPLHPTGKSADVALCFRSLDTLLVDRKPRPRWSPALIKHTNLRWFRQPLAGRLRGWSEHQPLVGLGEPPRVEASPPHPTWRVIACIDNGVPTLRLLSDAHQASTEVPELSVNGVRYHETTSAVVRPDGWCVSYSLPDLPLWYPHTHGDAALHEVVLHEKDGSQQRWRVGFRDIRINHQSGEFRINGVHVFIRGACWMPPVDPFSDPLSLINQARAAGFNLLRITGTSWYGTEPFFAACDRIGMLVWQDLPMASMDYPSTPEFVREVLSELDDQLPRITAHPSLAVVCGNSDGQQQATYHGLTVDRRSTSPLEAAVAEAAIIHLGHDRFIPGAPSGGALPTHTTQGFSSYFGIGAYLRPLQDRSVDRVTFAAECLGFANIPASKSLREHFGAVSPQVTTAAWKQGVPRDAGAGWDFDDVRDHYTRDLFNISTDALRRNDPARYIDLSSASSGIAMAHTMARWRTCETRCNGALVWTLNDRDPGAGWGLIDSSGIPKAACFLLGNVCNPVQVLVTDEGLDGHFVHLINETNKEIHATLRVNLIRPDGRAGASCTESVTLTARSNRSLSVDGLFGRFQDTTWTHRFGNIVSSAVCVSLLAQDDELQVLSQQLIGVGSQLTELSTQPVVRADLTPVHGDVSMTLEADRLLQYVEIEADGWQADRRYFHVLPCQPTRVLLRGGQTGEAPSMVRLKALNVPAPMNVRSSARATD